MTLKDVWEQQGLHYLDVARLAGISLPSLWKMNQKKKVHPNNLNAVLRVLNLSEADYQSLEPCPRRNEFPTQ